MPPLPKPTKADRVAAKQQRQQGLKAFRQQQVAIAIERDDDQCAICWFRYGRSRRREEVHHVYSRGKQAGDWRERYTSLLCVCRECHPLPVKSPGGSKSLGWVEDILRQANETPINPQFRSRKDG